MVICLLGKGGGRQTDRYGKKCEDDGAKKREGERGETVKVKQRRLVQLKPEAGKEKWLFGGVNMK